MLKFCRYYCLEEVSIYVFKKELTYSGGLGHSGLKFVGCMHWAWPGALLLHLVHCVALKSQLP